MTHKPLDERLQRVQQIAQDYLRANGYAVVTEDQELFPHIEPALAALKDGRLLVFALAEFPSGDQFLRPEELIHIRDDLEEFIVENDVQGKAHIRQVNKVALVICPDDITVASPAGDIRWLIVRDEDEVPEELDRLAAWSSAY